MNANATTYAVNVVSASSLTTALEKVRRASSERECAAALVTVATMLQEAVLRKQPMADINDAIDACPDSLGMVLGAAMDRAVNFTQTERGTMGLWLLPVRLVSEEALPGLIQLTNDKMRAMKMAAAVQAQMKLLESSVPGWCFTIPALVSDEALRNAELSSLIQFPQQVQSLIQGEREQVSFIEELDFEEVEAGVSVYYLPMVIFHPNGTSLDAPTSSEQLVHRMFRWVEESVAPETVTEITVSSVPQPFSLALRVGQRMELGGRFRQMMLDLRAKSDIDFNGMAALVTPYEVRNKDEDLLLGVSLVSRLTKTALASMTLPVLEGAGEEEMAIVTAVLNELGVERVQQHQHPVGTIACQHCGNIQFALPSMDTVEAGMIPDSHTIN